jgi:hypothetical protein
MLRARIQGEGLSPEESPDFRGVAAEGRDNGSAFRLIENGRPGRGETAAQGGLVGAIAEGIGWTEDDDAGLHGGQEFRGGGDVVAVATENKEVGPQIFGPLSQEVLLSG